MTTQELKTALDAMTDSTYMKYQSTVISDTHYPMKHIRMPLLRQLAKSAAEESWQELVRRENYDSFEEVMVTGLAIAYAKAPFEAKMAHLRLLLPHLDSWALTDCIVPTLKITASERDCAWDFAMECLESDREYTVRFGIIMLLHDFLTARDIPRTAQVLCGIQDSRYYVQMAVAWCLAEMAVTAYGQVVAILDSGVLNDFVQNKAIQKMRESYRITPEQKAASAERKRK